MKGIFTQAANVLRADNPARGHLRTLVRRTLRHCADRLHLSRPYLIWRETRRLQKLSNIACDPSPLAEISPAKLSEMMTAQAPSHEWPAVESELAALNIPDTTGGINYGDRRAIYFLVRSLRPSNVLEIGTHIGASTVAIACALRQLSNENEDRPYRLTTVDIADVNDPQLRPWIKYGAQLSPQEEIERLGCSDQVTFTTQASGTYLANCQEKYDLIFLDGDHSSAAVYREIPAALRLLNPDGAILLHDVFPNLEALWSDDLVIPGPFLALERLKKAGIPILLVPFGQLPWPTKLGSRVSSLALLGRLSPSR
jgi:predicted O-methyltransferase YrrM